MATARVAAPQVRRAVRLEYFTITWNVVEAVVAVGAGIAAGSIALNSKVGCWWADPVAALGIAALAIREGNEARQGKGRTRRIASLVAAASHEDVIDSLGVQGRYVRYLIQVGATRRERPRSPAP